MTRDPWDIRRVTFLEWCRWCRKHPGSIGDFARDWIADPDRPRAPTMRMMVDYLEDHGAIDEAIEAAKACYADWQRFQAMSVGDVVIERLDRPGNRADGRPSR